MNGEVRRVDTHIAYALGKAFDAIWSDVVGGRYTAKEARRALVLGWDEAVASAWDEWYAEGED